MAYVVAAEVSNFKTHFSSPVSLFSLPRFKALLLNFSCKTIHTAQTTPSVMSAGFVLHKANRTWTFLVFCSSASIHFGRPLSLEEKLWIILRDTNSEYKLFYQQQSVIFQFILQSPWKFKREWVQTGVMRHEAEREREREERRERVSETGPPKNEII